MDHDYTPREELLNSLTHGAGILVSAGGAAVLITFAALQGDPWMITSIAIFGATLVLLYTASTLYHSARSPRWKARLKVLDHASIYLLIAGTYTPFMLGPLRGGWGWSLFGVIWGLAAAGVIFKLLFTGRFSALSTIVYILMGWLALVAIVPIVRHLAADTLTWLVVGGVVYTVGTIFYHNRRVPYSHAVWHVFVLGGSVCHGVAVGTL